MKQDIYFNEGDKVKLNYERITSAPDYPKLSKAYRNFVENNKDKVLTVEYDAPYYYAVSGGPLWVRFKEDKQKLKWLFCIHDLVLAEEN